MQTKNRIRVLAASGAVAGAAALAVALPSAEAICNGDAENPNCPPDSTMTVVHARGTVDVAAGQTLGVRGVPKQNAPQFRQLRDGATALITCQTRGSKVSGTFGTSRVWNHLKHGGYVSDVYVYTGSDGRVAPQCGS